MIFSLNLLQAWIKLILIFGFIDCRKTYKYNVECHCTNFFLVRVSNGSFLFLELFIRWTLGNPSWWHNLLLVFVFLFFVVFFFLQSNGMIQRDLTESHLLSEFDSFWHMLSSVLCALIRERGWAWIEVNGAITLWLVCQHDVWQEWWDFSFQTH